MYLTPGVDKKHEKKKGILLTGHPACSDPPTRGVREGGKGERPAKCPILQNFAHITAFSFTGVYFDIETEKLVTQLLRG